MFSRLFYILFAFSFVTLAAIGANAQTGADNRPAFYPGEDMPKGVKETYVKMRIEKEKKEHEEMLRRAEEVRSLSERLEKSFAQNGSFSDEDLSLLASLEKDVKKIREDLGGDGDDEKIEEVLGSEKTLSFANAVKTLKTAATNLADELKKTTRFTISATAIKTSNTMITVARFLRIKK
ncbi:MAG: hypothetical protein ACKVRN_13955 [Pyrinomonadaceae bacterium]